MSKSTEVEHALRVKEVLELLANGHTRPEICRHAATKWGCSSRQTDRYMHEAKQELLVINKVSLEENLAMVVRNQWKIFRRCMAKDDLNTARNILSDIAKIKGITMESVLHVIDDKREYAKMPDNELEKLLLEETH